MATVPDAPDDSLSSTGPEPAPPASRSRPRLPFDRDEVIRTALQLRNPIQLAGFLFSVLAATLIRYVDPANVQSLTVVGAIGLGLVSVPLLFHPALLKLITPGQRLPLILGTLVILLASFGALAVVTAVAVLKGSLPPHGARFDTALEPRNVRVVSSRPGGPHRLEIVWDLVPLSTDPKDSATLFIGMVTLHDESLLPPGMGQKVSATCAEVASCVGARVFREYASDPVFVRAGSARSSLTTSIDVRHLPQQLRIWWEFYQREGFDQNRCGVDNTLPAPADGIPPLAMFSPKGERVANYCYRSFGQRTVSLS